MAVSFVGYANVVCFNLPLLGLFVPLFIFSVILLFSVIVVIQCRVILCEVGQS